MTQTSTTTPERSLLPAPILVGGHVAMDFVNSVYGKGSDRVEMLSNGDGLKSWLGSAGADTQALLKSAETLGTMQWEEAAIRARELRDWIAGVLPRWGLGGPDALTEDDLRHLNACMAPLKQSWQVARIGSAVSLDLHPASQGAAEVVAGLAVFCTELLVKYPSDRAHKCANPDCTLWFVDMKKGPARRWCSMAICGNRMKVAAHRSRNRALSPSPTGDSPAK